MRHVFAGKISLFLGMLLGMSGWVGAQAMHHFDVRPLNLGFTMGLNYATFKTTTQVNTTDTRTGEVVKRVAMQGKPGIYLGLITNFKISNNFDFRFLPSVSLEQRDFLFYFVDSTTTRDPIVYKKVESSNLNLPFCIKFKSNYYKNTRVYVMGGMQASINMSSNKKVMNDPELIKTDALDVAYVAAVGIDLYGEKLKLSPELRYTLGTSNIYVKERTRFPTAISDIYSQTLVLTVNFE